MPNVEVKTRTVGSGIARWPLVKQTKFKCNRHCIAANHFVPRESMEYGKILRPPPMKIRIEISFECAHLRVCRRLSPTIENTSLAPCEGIRHWNLLRIRGEKRMRGSFCPRMIRVPLGHDCESQQGSIHPLHASQVRLGSSPAALNAIDAPESYGAHAPTRKDNGFRSLHSLISPSGTLCTH